MILKKLTPNHPDIPALKKLFEEAFPENERPFGIDGILAFLDQMPCDLLGVYPDETPDEFSGFFFGIRGESSVYGVYFATRPDLRSTGIGSKAFKAVLEYYDDIPFWFSYESTFEESNNAEQRERRRRFYLKNGFYETGWFAKLNGTEFIIASSKKEFDKEAFEKFMGAMFASTTGAVLPELYRRVKQTLILGNIITMDEKRPFAKAALVKDGVFAYIGSAEEAKKLAGADAQVLDYGDNFVYPGFMESHCHGSFAGERAIGQANLMEGGLTTDYARYRNIIKAFIEKNPQRDFYVAAGWVENEEYVSKAYLDEICSDKPLLMQTGGGHSMLLNSKAMEWAGIDAAYAKKWGYDLVHVDKNGEPDGYICEGPVFEVAPKLPTTLEDIKEYLLAWQEMALSSGFTAVGDAGAEVIHRVAPQAYYELQKEGKLKLRTYAWMYVTDNADAKTEIARIAAQRAEMSGEYFHIIGPKAFLDGVTEAHTGWQNQDYLDQPGYHGNERFNNHDKMVELIVEADKEGMSVHVHSEGGGATHYMLGCIEDAEKITGNLDQRNVLAHLHFVTDEDCRRMGATGSVTAVPPLWTAKASPIYEQEVAYMGQELADQAYPIKSFYDAGANVVFHSDYPVSPMMDIKLSIYAAEKRDYPKELTGGATAPRNLKEAITREQSLRAMTINVARQFHQEHRLGSIEFGKIANMTVFDCDFLHDDIEKVGKANIIATIVDGEEVYKA